MIRLGFFLNAEIVQYNSDLNYSGFCAGKRVDSIADP